MKKRAWVFTLNNYTVEEIPLFQDYDAGTIECNWVIPVILYVAHGKEVSASGTPHLQGMVVFKRSVGLKTLKSLNPRAHWEPMRGTIEEARDYCRKDALFIEWWNFARWARPALFKKLKEAEKEDRELTVLDKRNELSLSTLFDNVAKVSERQKVLEDKLDRLVAVTLKMIRLREGK